MTEEQALELAVEHDCVTKYYFFKIFLGFSTMEILERLGIIV